MTEEECRADEEIAWLTHTRIENCLRFLGPSTVYGLSRADALAALKACALRTGRADIEHMVEAVLAGQEITREDLANRIQAFIDLDEEEKAERAFRAACEAEEAA